MSETKVLQGNWRKLNSGAWGVELRSVGWEDVTGQIVEVVRRSDGARSQFRLAKRVSHRRGKLHPLYAIEKIEKEEK